MKKRTIKALTSILSLSLIVIPAIVFAAIENPLGAGNNNVEVFIPLILGYVVKIGGVVAIGAFIYSGFLFVKAQGNPEGLKTAKTVFMNTCIGVAVLLGAQLIATIINGTISSLK